MGNFEKLVVLAVLLVAGLVLAISFNRGSDEVEAADPLSGAKQVLELEPPLTGESLENPSSALQGETLDGKTETSLLLNAGGESTPAFGSTPAGLRAESQIQPQVQQTLSLQPESDPTRPILMATTGLRPSFLDDHMVYTVAEGDTWSSLAQLFYQDGRYTRNLVQANDDVVLTPGQDILVPKYDFLALDAGLQSAGTTSEPAGAPTATAFSPKPLDVVPTGVSKALEYEVKPGDTLSDISLAVFGTSTRWKELLEANSDKLRTPESLQVGMKLKIPEGGKLPVAGAPKSATKTPPSSVAKKSEPKPAKSEPKTDSTPKKKKVL